MMVHDEMSLNPINPRSLWSKGPDFHIRVMGVVDGWVVMRRKGCHPFLLHINDFLKTYKPVEQKRR